MNSRPPTAVVPKYIVKNDSTNVNYLPENDLLLESVTKITKPTDKCKNNKSKRISAGAEKKHKRKHRKLKYNYINSRKVKDIEKLKDKRENMDVNKNRNKEIPLDSIKGIQVESSDSSKKRAEKTNKELHLKINKARKTEAEYKAEQHAKKLAESGSESTSKRNTVKDKKFEKGRRRNKKSAEELAPEILEGPVSDKDKTKKTTVECKDVKKSSTNSESVSQRKKTKKKDKKVNEKKGNIKVIKNLAQKDKDGDSSKKESKSVSDSEKIKSKEGKIKRVHENIHQLKVKDKQEDKKHGDKSESRFEESKIKMSRRKKAKTEHIRIDDEVIADRNENEVDNKVSELKKDEKMGKKKSKSKGKMKRVDEMLMSGEEKNEEIKAREKVGPRRKPGSKLLQVQGKKDKPQEDTKMTKRSTSTSTPLSSSDLTSLASFFTSLTDTSVSVATLALSSVKSNISNTLEKNITKDTSIAENEISDDDDEQMDQKAGFINEEKKEQMTMIAKEPIKKMVRTKMYDKPEKYNMEIRKDLISTAVQESDGTLRNDRRIMYVFIQKNREVQDIPLTSPNGTSKTQKTESDTTQKPESESPEMTAVPNKIKEKEVVDKKSSPNLVISPTDTSTTYNDQGVDLRIPDEKQGREEKLEQELKIVKDDKKTIASSDMNSVTEQNETNISKDQSYVDGLAQIRAILEIYGIEEDKAEAFNNLLNEEISNNEKEIAENLKEAICDLPMNTELLEKVLKKMRYSGLLKKQEYKTLQKNLVPEAKNESVTVALLVQVLQRQKFEK